jgi:hypothetical protein
MMLANAKNVQPNLIGILDSLKQLTHRIDSADGVACIVT